MGEVKIDDETLSQQYRLNPDQEDAIAEEAYKEMEEEEKQRKGELEDDDDDDDDDDDEDTDEKKDEEKDGDDDEGDEDDDDDDEEKKEEELLKLAEDALEKEEKDLTEDEKQAVELFNKKQEESINKQAEELSKEIGMKLDDAKSEVESWHKVMNKYKKNPLNMAKTLLHSAREYSKLKNEFQSVQEKLKEQNLEEGEMILDGKVYSREAAREKLVEAYREKEADLTEDLDDDKVYKLAVKQIRKDRKELQEAEARDAKEKALSTRTDLLKGIPEEDKKYLPEVQKFLDNVPDDIVVKDGFSIMPFVWGAKGKVYDDDVKAAEERGYKRGLEDRKIVEERKGPSKKKSGSSGKKKGWDSLTDSQKNEALDMFPDGDYTDDERAEAFSEIIEHENKIKKKRGG